MNFWTLADGRRLAYREAGRGPLLLLMHGWAMSSAVFTDAIDRLADRFHVLAPDLPGHGKSDAGGGYRFADLSLDLYHWISGLGISGATLVGWSMGGQILLTLYPQLRERVARVILVSSTPAFAAGDDWPHGLPATRLRVMGRNLGRHFQRTLDDFHALQFAGDTLPPGRQSELVALLQHDVPTPLREAALGGLEELRSSDQRDHLGSVDCPSLVVHGADDAIVPVEAGRFLARHLPQARLEVLRETGHAPFLSRPEETLELWRSFIP